MGVSKWELFFRFAMLEAPIVAFPASYATNLLHPAAVTRSWTAIVSVMDTFVTIVLRFSSTMKERLAMDNNSNAPFVPDVEIHILQNSKTGQTIIKSATGQPVNPVYLIVLCAGIIQANGNAILQAQPVVAQHDFFALAGETKCRKPRCGQSREHAIHTVNPTPPGLGL